MPVRLFVSAGEASGDRHAAAVVRALRARVGAVDVRGLGGDALRAEGAELLAHTDDLSVIGFAEVLKRLPYFMRVMRRARSTIESWQPDLVLPVDYPGFNLRLGRWCRSHDVPVVYYIAPQVWAWKKDRLPGIRAAVDRLLVVFPFEEALFAQGGIPTVFVGHPLLDHTTPIHAETVRRELDLDAQQPVLALLPGSRRQEVEAILPTLVAAAQSLKAEGVQAVVSRAPGRSEDLYACARTANIPLWDGPAGALVGAADAALVASGTATLETGLHGTPLAVVYKTGRLNWWMARRVVSIQTIGLVNIAAGGSLVPEFLQGEATAARIATSARSLLFDEQVRTEQQRYLAGLRERLGGGGSAERAAEEIANFLEARCNG